MSKLHFKFYLSCIVFVFCPVIVSPAFAISNQSAISFTREDYPIVTPIEVYSSEDYPSITPVQEPDVEIASADATLDEAARTDAKSDFDRALKLREEADKIRESADTIEEWNSVSRKLLEAIELLLQASQDETQRIATSQIIGVFQSELNDSLYELSTLSSGEETQSVTQETGSGRSRVGIGLIGLPINNSEEHQEEKNKYDAWELVHRKNTLRLQLYSSIAIFALVVVIVVAGILLSYEQLRKGASSETKFSIKGGAVEISSSIIGFLILFLSLAFFYLYLKEVYPVHEIGAARDNAGLVDGNQVN